MYARKNISVTAERAERRRKFNDIDERATVAAARGAAPPREHFDERRRRFVDDDGRVYVLPVRGDPLAAVLFERGDAAEFYEPDYDEVVEQSDVAGGAAKAQSTRRGFAYQPSKSGARQVPELSGTVFMYVARPKNAVYRDARLGTPVPAMPPVRGSAGDTRPNEPLRLYQCDQANCVLDDGERYTASVERTVGKRRAARGQVFLGNVKAAS